MEAAKYGPFGNTQRKDAWWSAPLATAGGLAIAGAYLTWAALQGEYYEFGPYLSPLYAPFFKPDWLGNYSPALLILWAPGGFRATCYYYRKAYYRSFFASPPACSVQGVSRKSKYLGETSFPFVLQNAHRYFLYLALVFNVILWVDALRSFSFAGEFGIGLGSVVMTINAFLLMMYSFSCHCFRHLMGGKTDCFSNSHTGSLRYKIWNRVSVFNEYHMQFAWVSLFWVSFTDLYVRLCAMGVWNDIRFF